MLTEDVFEFASGYTGVSLNVGAPDVGVTLYGWVNPSQIVLPAGSVYTLHNAYNGTNPGFVTTGKVLEVLNGYVHAGGMVNPTIPSQGAYLSWNRTGGIGETDFINSKGGGSGGWYFYNMATGTTLGLPPLRSRRSAPPASMRKTRTAG
jgi:hypothetical protein